MILYLMRHGQTNEDLKGRIQGIKDTPLNQAGIEQIRNLSQKLKDEKISVIYSSTLKRARKSAELVATVIDVPVHFTNRLKEMNFGEAEGLNKRDLKAKYPYISEAFYDLSNKERYDIGYPKGETIGQVQTRFMKFLDKILKEKRDNVLVITHPALICIFAQICLKKDIRLENASVLKVMFNEKSKKFKYPKILY